MYPEHYYWPMWFFPMFMPFFWIIVIAVFLYLIFGRGSTRRPWHGNMPFGPASGEETPLEILKKRYARGEITKDEFEQIKRDIES